MTYRALLFGAALVAVVAYPLLAQTRYTVSDELAAGPGTPRLVVLRDQVAGIEAAVAPSEGGELSSYRVKLNGQWTEFLYRARDYSGGAGFKGKGPLLWPALGAQYPVGTVPEASCGPGPYQVGEDVYHALPWLRPHDPWKEVRRSAELSGATVVELRESDATLAVYPFAFAVAAAYELAGGHLTIDYTVTSGKSNMGEMPFSIGNHIAFKVPFITGSDPSKMTLRQPAPSNCSATQRAC